MLGKAMLPTDEELGKKDDDHNFKPARRPGAGWPHSPRWRRKRVLLLVGAFCLFSLAMHYMSGPTPDAPPAHHASFQLPHAAPPRGSQSDPHTADAREPAGPPPGMRAPRRGHQAPHTFDGLYKFYRLAKSLRGAAHTDGFRKTNRNVLFAMSSLQSAATLLPLVCEMSKWNRNWVHAAFVGRADIPLDAILDINGIDRKQCPAIWHDARPDYAEYSTDARAEAAVQSALSHLQNFLHPQVAITDDPAAEDAFFAAAVRNKTAALDIPLIEVPAGRWDAWGWLTRLDAAALRAWHVPSIDVVVQVPPDSSSVLQLLRSLAAADYTGLRAPRLTLELPAALDPVVERALQNLQWPPPAHPQTPDQNQNQNQNQLILRRRLTPPATPSDAAARVLDAFWPQGPDAHVLLLAPTAQLATQWLHYARYHVLEYGYSSFSPAPRELLGVSLLRPDVPAQDGSSGGKDGGGTGEKTKLRYPGVRDLHDPRYATQWPDTTAVPFLRQTMDSVESLATLFFADGWREFWEFGRLRSEHRAAFPAAKKEQEEGERGDANGWTAWGTQFMRARGLFVLVPARPWGVLHREIDGSSTSSADPNTRNQEPPLPPASKSLTYLLPFDADLPVLSDLPHLLHNNILLDPGSVGSVARKYGRVFREEVGGCGGKDKKEKGEGSVGIGRAREDRGVRGLFCFGDEDEEEEWEEGLGDEGVGAAAAAAVTGAEAVGVGSSRSVTMTSGSATATATASVAPTAKSVR
ncbi:hypothetical protein C7974DRAFT_321465 [Boeremia exigua]|uniref:uncharacterized protein n=1 Tax=Boeremia exigua TaxID=749465 RepID=UPI001E8CB936|nr:uncharacterized protein C7974DRAFT_321465 [Boeremia exigua]KAH6614313.1 hypothetical protein C7974DRAFT_321465 [Boeremia exigua]